MRSGRERRNKINPAAKPKPTVIGVVATVVVILMILAAVLLSGCASQKVSACAIPESLLVPKEVPPFTGKTNREIGIFAVEMREGWKSCEQDKRAAVSP